MTKIVQILFLEANKQILFLQILIFRSQIEKTNYINQHHSTEYIGYYKMWLLYSFVSSEHVIDTFLEDPCVNKYCYSSVAQVKANTHSRPTSHI